MEPGAVSSRTSRRVRETSDRNRTFELSLQPLRLLVETALADAHMAGPEPDVPLFTRMLAAFPFQMIRVLVRGVRRYQPEPYPQAERMWLQVTVDRDPGVLRVVETRSPRADGFHKLPLEPDVSGVATHLLGFYRSFWPDLPGS